MPYVQFDSTKPDAADNGTAFAQSTRDNLAAVRDMVVTGAFVGWAMSVTVGAGSAEQPDMILRSQGTGATTEILRATITWGTGGGADGNPTAILYEYSANNGGAYAAMGTLGVTYDAAGNVSATAWS